MQNKEVSRGQFLKTLGMSSKALMAFYCLGTLASCSSEDDPNPVDSTNPGDGNAVSGIVGTSTGSSIDFTIDLTNANFSKLLMDGGFEYAGDIIIVNTGSKNFIALSKKCTRRKEDRISF